MRRDKGREKRVILVEGEIGEKGRAVSGRGEGEKETDKEIEEER